MTKRVRIVVITVTVLVFLAGLGVFLNCKKKEDNISYKNTATIKITEFNLNNRAVLNTESGIYVGNNLKELENGFYDIKIVNKNNYVEVYFNKLWYETYGDDYIQDEYLAKICRKLSEGLENGTQEVDFENILYKYIKDNYLSVRGGKTAEKLSTEKYILELDFKQEGVRLSIRGNKV